MGVGGTACQERAFHTLEKIEVAKIYIEFPFSDGSFVPNPSFFEEMLGLTTTPFITRGLASASCSMHTDASLKGKRSSYVDDAKRDGDGSRLAMNRHGDNYLLTGNEQELHMRERGGAHIVLEDVLPGEFLRFDSTDLLFNVIHFHTMASRMEGWMMDRSMPPTSFRFQY